MGLSTQCGAVVRRRVTRMVEEVTFSNADGSRLQLLTGPHESTVSEDVVEANSTADMPILPDDSELTTTTRTQPISSFSQGSEPLLHESKKFTSENVLFFNHKRVHIIYSTNLFGLFHFGK